jgi:acyl-CoA reductase-like NAD-dependent aldehyde dehydrogenase
MKLKDVYPLYLNNKAAQPNTDLEVTDKFTGEVAFRTALATPDVIDAAIAGAVRAAEPMARLASFEKRDVLSTASRAFRSGSTSWPMRSASRRASRSPTARARSTG